MSDAEILFESITKTYQAVERIQQALGLPFRPLPLQPIADAHKQINDVFQELAGLRARVKSLEQELERERNHTDRA